MIVVSDTTPILSLLKAGRLSLLEELYKTVAVPKAVFAELTNNAAYEDEKSEIVNCSFIPASNEPSGRACTDIWRLPRGSNTPQLCCVFNFDAP